MLKYLILLLTTFQIFKLKRFFKRAKVRNRNKPESKKVIFKIGWFIVKL